MTKAHQALAIDGGEPVRRQLLPYGRHSISNEDVAAVTEVLRSDWLTTGPKVGEFERAFAEFVGVRDAVAVAEVEGASGTIRFDEHGDRRQGVALSAVERDPEGRPVALSRGWLGEP